MPATFVVQSITPDSGMRKALLVLMHEGKPNYVHVNATPAVMAMIFGEDVQEGDTRDVRIPLRMRAGTNGLNKA